MARLRSRLRVRRLESRGPSVFAGAGHAALRRRLGGTAAAIVAAADCPGRRCERRLRSCRCTRGGARGRPRGCARQQRRAGANGAAGSRRCRPAHARALERARPQPRRQALRRSAGRCHRRRHRARRTRGLHIGRASEALHDARHGTGPGQDEQRRRHCAPRRDDRQDDPRGRHDDVSPAVHARHARRVPGAGKRRASRADAVLRDARLARRARRALRQRRAVEAAAFVSASRRVARRRREPRGEERAHERGRGRRLHARQDRAARARRRRIAESRLHQPLGHARRRPLPLRRDAARGRHRRRRRHDLAPRTNALPDDDDDRQCGQSDAAPRAAAADRLAGARRLRHLGHRAVGGGGAGGTEGARRAGADRRHRRLEFGIPVPCRRRSAAFALRADRFRRVFSG